jgi:transposase
MRTTRPTYTEEFRNDALNLLHTTDRPVKQIAKDLGISEWTLREWYRKSEMAKKPKKNKASARPAVLGDETTEQKLARLERENSKLRRENDSLKMDREILKKAAAFFAKESE